jgi:hypothetical protein
MIQLNAFNQPLVVACQNRGTANLFPNGCSLPFEIGLPATGGARACTLWFHTYRQRAVACESRDGSHPDIGATQDQSVKCRMWSKGIAECGDAIFADNCHQVVSW